jgi:hypothetical protein
MFNAFVVIYLYAYIIYPSKPCANYLNCVVHAYTCIMKCVLKSEMWLEGLRRVNQSRLQMTQRTVISKHQLTAPSDWSNETLSRAFVSIFPFPFSLLPFPPVLADLGEKMGKAKRVLASWWLCGILVCVDITSATPPLAAGPWGSRSPVAPGDAGNIFWLISLFLLYFTNWLKLNFYFYFTSNYVFM